MVRQPGAPRVPRPFTEEDFLKTGAIRCRAKSRQTGERCKQAAMSGGTTCRYHGGLAPQVRRAAKLRLLELVDPAIATLAREMTNQQARAADRIRAAEAILDRAGHPRQVQTTAEDAREMLLQRLMQLRDQVMDEQDQLVEQAALLVDQQAASTRPEIVEGEVAGDAS